MGIERIYRYKCSKCGDVEEVSSYDNHNIDIVPDCWTIITTKCILANGLDCETTAAYCRDCSEGWGQLVDDILFAEVPEI